MQKIGPTGAHPKGKLVEEDKGELQFAITVVGGRLKIFFGTFVYWLGFDLPDVKALAEYLESRKKQVVSTEKCSTKWTFSEYQGKLVWDFPGGVEFLLLGKEDVETIIGIFSGFSSKCEGRLN